MARSDDLPYRYKIHAEIIVAGDGLHADGDGAVATRNRLEEQAKADGLVVEVRFGHPSYVGGEQSSQRA